MELNHELMTINPIIDSIFRFILFIENRVLAMINFPIGVSLFAICKKNNQPSISIVIPVYNSQDCIESF